MTPDGIVRDQPLPSFLSADKTDEQDVGTIWEAAAISSRALKVIILAATMALIGIVALEVTHPVMRVPKFMAPLIGMSSGQQDTSPSTPTGRSSAEAEVSASVEGGAPARDDIAAAPQPAGQMQTGGNRLSSDELFTEFQAWAARRAAPAQGEPVPPDETGPAPIAVDAPMPAPPLQKQRKPKPAPAQNAQAQIPHIPIPRARMQWGQTARVDGRPAPAPRVQEQNSATPSWLQSLSSHQ